jgi:hypothetical protein
MHLSPAAIESAIRLLDQADGPSKGGPHVQEHGDILETGDPQIGNIKK